MSGKTLWVIAAVCALIPFQTGAQSATDKNVLKGLAPVSVLSNTAEGKAALAANYKVTGGIQNGTIKQPTLLPFAQQQQQALQDAFITGNIHANYLIFPDTFGGQPGNPNQPTSQPLGTIQTTTQGVNGALETALVATNLQPTQGGVPAFGMALGPRPAMVQPAGRGDRRDRLQAMGAGDQEFGRPQRRHPWQFSPARPLQSGLDRARYVAPSQGFLNVGDTLVMGGAPGEGLGVRSLEDIENAHIGSL